MAQFLPKAASGLAERARSLGTTLLRNRSVDEPSQCKSPTRKTQMHSGPLQHSASVDIHGYSNPLLDRPAPLPRAQAIPEERVTKGSTLASDLNSMEGQPKFTDQKTVLTNLRRVKLISQPKGTILYSVSSSDMLASIAAKFDTTTSELMKLNKLMSQMIFPGQMLYVPDKDYILSAPTSPVFPPMPCKSFPPSDPPVSPTFTVGSPVRGSMLPGRAERQEGVISLDPPHPLSEVEVKRLDDECYERFIKVNVKHITDGQGVVSGVLLVTPNAIMFDPNVSDTLVIERGADAYGMIAPMETVISAAMYHDIAAMRLKGVPSNDKESNAPRPEVYHAKGCRLSAHASDSVATTRACCNDGSGVATSETSVPEPNNSGQSQGNFNEKSDRRDSGCSCDGTAVAPSSDNKQLPDVFADLFIDNMCADDEVQNIDKVSETKQPHEDSGSSVVGKTTDNQGRQTNSVHDSDSSSASAKPVNCDLHLEGAGKVTDKSSDKTQTVDSVNKTGGDVRETPGGAASEAVATAMREDDRVKVGENEKLLSPIAVDNSASPDSVVSGTPNLQIGNIQYFQFEDVTFALPTTGDAPKPESETPPVGSVDSHGSGSILSRTLDSFSSLSPSFNTLVDFSSGLFAKNQAYRGPVKDIATVLSDEAGVTTGVHDSTSTSPGSPPMTIGSVDVQVRNAVRMADKPDLFRSLDELIPRPAILFEDPPLYLCLKIGKPLHKTVSKTCPIESYTKRHKPEYWFSIPRNKVDHLYAFFVQWSPNIYGSEEDIDPRERGFVVLDDSDTEEGEKGEDDEWTLGEEYVMGDRRPKLARQMTKDWEIVKVEEAQRRVSLAEEESVPLPELSEDSKILEQLHIRKINANLPARAVGYPWRLVYSTEKHGFSLKTIYRFMKHIECPMLLVVKDTNHNVFGAYLSCALKISEYFYGTGESLLYTFYPEYKTFYWTGENDFFTKGNAESISFGAGEGSFGLWLDGDLYHGRTQHCLTYDNDLLTTSEDFFVQAVEVFAFA